MEKKKICILSAVNIRHMSMISIYTELMKKNNIEYDIIYMDKYDEEEPFECAHRYRYVNKVDQKWFRAFKMAKYMMFLPYAAKILDRNKYDFVIVWNDVAIFMFADYLSRRYQGKYCLNVRDNMWYNKDIWKKRYEKVFKNAAFSTISSRGYLDFLPKNVEYLPIHSLNLAVLEGMNRHNGLRKEGEPIRIGFIGYVRFFERNKRMLDVFANDPRFELHYYGTKADVLREYAEEKGICNTDFHDSFPVEDTKKYLERVDVINNLYGNDTINLQKAISIKFFHALYSRIPILVCPNTYVGRLAQDVGIGYEVTDINEQFKEDFYRWYRDLDYSTLQQSCESFLKQAISDNKQFEEKALKYLR